MGAHDEIGYGNHGRASGKTSMARDFADHLDRLSLASEEDRDRIEIEGIREIRKKYPSVQWKCSRVANKGF